MSDVPAKRKRNVVVRPLSPRYTPLLESSVATIIRTLDGMLVDHLRGLSITVPQWRLIEKFADDLSALVPEAPPEPVPPEAGSAAPEPVAKKKG